MHNKSKLKINLFLVLPFLFLINCQSENKNSTKIISPSAKYYLTTSVNNTDESKEDYAYVIINLFDAAGNFKTAINTNAANYSKWAVGWDTQKDTVIFYSSDIGTFAWKLNLDSLKKINVTTTIKETAQQINLSKYKNVR